MPEMGLFRGPTTQVTNYSGLQVQTTSAATPVPIVWGENMLTPNCIDYRNFHSKKVSSKSGGKGGALASVFGSSGETVYLADILMAVCEGPIADIFEVYQTSLTPISLSQAGLDLVVGNVGQAPTSYWTSTYPAYALGYTGIAYVWATNFDLGPSATIGTNSLVVRGLRYGTGFNGIDADPALVIEDFLTSTQYGVGFPTGEITNLTGASGDSSLQSYCQAVGLAFSPVLTDREAANSILDRWLGLLNCTCVWTSGVLKFVPRGDEAVTGNGWTWTPDLTVQYDLTDDSYYVESGKSSSDPVQVKRSSPYDIDNWISIEIVDRANNFNTGPIPAFDQSAMDQFGTRVGSTISAHEITHLTVGQISAQLTLQRGLYVRRTFTFKLSWEYCRLDPMDVVTLTDTRIGLQTTPVRITEIEEDDRGFLSVTAEELTIGVATAATYAIQTPSNGTPNGNVTPNAVNPPIVFEPPTELTNDTVQVWAAVSPQSADPNWGGCIVNASFDGTSYSAVGTLNSTSTMGALTSSLASHSGSNPDTTNTISLSVAESGGALLSTTAANAALGASACWVDGEIIGYTTATLTGPGTYNLTGLYRGLYGTPITSHASGASFALLSSGLAKYTLPDNVISNTLYLKFQSFNIFGTGLQSLSSCTPYPYAITGAGLVSGAWVPYASTWGVAGGSSAPSVGNGTIAASYYKNGTAISLNIALTIGSTTTVGTGGSWIFSLPEPALAAASGTYLITDPSAAQIAQGTCSVSSTASEVSLYDPTLGLVGPATYTLAAGDQLTISLTYQAT